MSALLLTMVLAPLILAGVAGVWGDRAGFGYVAALGALPAVLGALLIPEGTSSAWGDVFLGARLGLDATGQVFSFFVGAVWLFAALQTVAYLADDRRARSFYVFFLLAMAGNVGVCLAQDIVTFYVSFALMSFAAYPLVIHTRTAAARRAGRVYIALVVAGEVGVFAGLALLVVSPEGVAQAGLAALWDRPDALPIAALLLFAFGIKAGALPLHVWLPLAHPVAPTPASAVLSAAMIKAGLLGWVRVLPLGTVALPSLGDVVVVGGVGAALYGAAVGVTQRDPKTVLAYSSISQMGLMTVLVGVGLRDPSSWAAALGALQLFALHHGLAKGALFLGTGVARAGTGGWARWGVPAGLVVSALALMGAPWTSGAVAKYALKEAVGDQRLPVAWLTLATVGTTWLMARFLLLTWRERDGTARPPWGLAAPWAFLVLTSAVAMWLLPWDGLRGRVVGSTHLLPSMGSLWPLALGVVTAGAALGAGLRGHALPRVPSGDLLLPLQALLDLGQRGTRAGVAASVRAWTSLRGKVLGGLVRAVAGVGRTLGRTEVWVRSWRTGATLFLVVVLLLLALVG